MGLLILFKRALVEELRDLAVVSCSLVRFLPAKDLAIVVHEFLRREVLAWSVLAAIVKLLVDDVGADVDVRVVVIVGHRDEHGLRDAGAESSRADLAVKVRDQSLVDRLSVEDTWVAAQTRHEVPPVVCALVLLLGLRNEAWVLRCIDDILVPVVELDNFWHDVQPGLPE